MKPMEKTGLLKIDVNRVNAQLRITPQESKKKKRQLSKNDVNTMKRRTKRNLNYISWLDNEQRMKNPITPLTS